MQVRMSPARIESILTEVRRVKEGQSLTVKLFQRLLGLMAAVSNVIPIGLLYMRPLQGWLKTKGFSPRGNPLCMIKVTRRCLCALDMWRQPWFLSQGADILSIKRAGAEAQGMDASPRGGEADLESVWPGSGGPLRYSGKYTVQCPLWYSLIHPAPLGLDAMVQTWSTLCLYVVPRSLCSREFWRECAGTRSVYLWYHRSGRVVYVSRT